MCICVYMYIYIYIYICIIIIRVLLDALHCYTIVTIVSHGAIDALLLGLRGGGRQSIGSLVGFGRIMFCLLVLLSLLGS